MPATNYNPEYTIDDGSCSFPGCMDSTYANYRDFATYNDGTCSNSRRQLAGEAETAQIRPITIRRQLQAIGCMDPDAYNYDNTSTVNNATLCEYQILGCTNASALNYFPSAEAEHDPSDCNFPIYGCTISNGTLNFDSTANVLDGCVYVQNGCMDSNATNYNDAANVDDGSCTFEVVGCTAMNALNYDSLATAAAADSCVFPTLAAWTLCAQLRRRGKHRVHRRLLRVRCPGMSLRRCCQLRSERDHRRRFVCRALPAAVPTTSISAARATTAKCAASLAFSVAAPLPADPNPTPAHPTGRAHTEVTSADATPPLTIAVAPTADDAATCATEHRSGFRASLQQRRCNWRRSWWRRRWLGPLARPMQNILGLLSPPSNQYHRQRSDHI